MRKTNLRVIETPATTEQVLTEAFDALSECEREGRRLKEIIAAEGRALAAKRGLAFIRFEGLKREFGGR